MAATSGKVIDLLDADGRTAIVQEGESCNVSGQLKNGADDVIKASLLSLVLTLYDESSSAVINSRDAQDVLDAAGGSVSAGGLITMALDPADNPIAGSAPAGSTEPHILRFKWTWHDGTSTRTGIQEFRLQAEKLASPA